MLEKIVTLYRKAQMGIVSGLSGATAKVIEETSFYDVGYMQTQISHIQKELKRIEGEVKTSIEIQDNSDYWCCAPFFLTYHYSDCLSQN